jgi:predicted nucleotidyltransferase
MLRRVLSPVSRVPGGKPMAQIELDKEQIAIFCRRWQITELALLGSVLRDDFSPDSDVDVLVRFAPDARHSLFDMVRIDSRQTHDIEARPR